MIKEIVIGILIALMCLYICINTYASRTNKENIKDIIEVMAIQVEVDKGRIHHIKIHEIREYNDD